MQYGWGRANIVPWIISPRFVVHDKFDRYFNTDLSIFRPAWPTVISGLNLYEPLTDVDEDTHPLRLNINGRVKGSHARARGGWILCIKRGWAVKGGYV